MSGSGDAFIYETLTNAIFDDSGTVAVTLNGTFEVEFNPAGTLVGVSNISLVAVSSDPGTNPSTLTSGSISQAGVPNEPGGQGLNEIHVTASSGSFPNAFLDFSGEQPTELAYDQTTYKYSSIGYNNGTVSGLEGIGTAGNPGTITSTPLPLTPVNNEPTILFATISNVIFDGYGNPITLNGTFEEQFNAGGTLINASNFDVFETINGTINELTGGYVNHAGDPNAGGYAALNEVVFQSVNNGNYNNEVYLDLLGEEPNAVFTGSYTDAMGQNHNSSDVDNNNYEPINDYGNIGSGGVITYTMACFAAGSRIATPRGDVPVQNLSAGDEVTLADGATAKIIWAGHRKLNIARHPQPEKVQPVIIAAGALGGNLPVRDLIVSPDHALYLDGVLIPAKALLNGVNITQDQTRKTVTYYHLELASHAVLLAEGTPAESYLETGNRNAFANAGPAVTLHPDFAQTMREAKSCAPFAESGEIVETVRTRILALAGAETTQEAGVTIKFAHGEAIIKSRTAIPGEVSADPRDRRTLGVKIATLSIAGRTIPLDHPALERGWYEPEPDGRWTDGAAIIPAELLGGSADVQLTLSGVLPYRVQRRQAAHA